MSERNKVEALLDKIPAVGLIASIRDRIGCSQRMVANLLGLEPHTLSKNLEKTVEELTPRTRRRLTALYFIVVQELGLYRSQVILDVIQAHVFPDLQDRMDSIVSAIQQDKYPLETLTHILTLSLKIHQAKANEAFIEISSKGKHGKAVSA